MNLLDTDIQVIICNDKFIWDVESNEQLILSIVFQKHAACFDIHVKNKTCLKAFC